MTKLRNQCSPDEIVRYTDDYFATMDSANEAAFKFDILAKLANSPSDRSLYRAKALEAQRDVEMLRNQRRAFNAGNGAINPPSDEEVATAVERSKKLADTQAEIASADAILKLFNDTMAAFGKIMAP